MNIRKVGGEESYLNLFVTIKYAICLALLLGGNPYRVSAAYWP
jgi:hypothetical protein